MYTETVADPKLRRLPVAQRWLWVAVLTAARRSPMPGRLLLAEGEPVTSVDLQDMAAVDMEDVRAGLEAFVRQKMLADDGGTWVVVNWTTRQFSSDDVYERVKRKRNVSLPPPGETYIKEERNVSPERNETFQVSAPPSPLSPSPRPPTTIPPITPPSETDTEAETEGRNGNETFHHVSEPGGQTAPPAISRDILDEMHAILSRFQDRGYMVDQRFYAKVSELYPRLDVALEALKLADWLKEPKNRRERCTARRVLNWLARAEEDRLRRLAEREQAKSPTVNLNGVAPKPYVPKPPPELPRFTPDQEKASDAARERVRQQLKAQGVLHKFDAIGGPSP
jgi:hypothetical protein